MYTKLMNGKIECNSIYGEGTEFTLNVDQKIVDAREVGEFSEDSGETYDSAYVPFFIAPDADVLIVEDNPADLRIIRELLKPTKIFVTAAKSGEEAIDKLNNGNFNLVFLDQQMPGMDGEQTLAVIRETHPDIPVYAMITNSSAGGDEYFKSKGFNGFLVKPIAPDVLEKVIMQNLPEGMILKPRD